MKVKNFGLGLSKLVALSVLPISIAIVATPMVAHSAPKPSQQVTPIHNGHPFDFQLKTDTSCNALLSDLSQHLQTSLGEVTVLHMTNYQAQEQWWGGWTQTRLRRSQNGHLVGTGSRLISSRSIDLGGGGPFGGQSQPFSVRSPDPMSYDIDPQGKITFQGQYGPYQMTCLDNKFAIVNSGDSIETFTFSKSTGPVVN